MRNWQTLLCVLLMTTTAAHAGDPQAPLYANSVASNDLDFIRPGDQAHQGGRFLCLEAQGRMRAEMPDKRGGDLFVEGVHHFVARFGDGAVVPIWVHPDVAEPARPATHVADALADLPAFMRQRLDHLVIHQGDETAFAESLGQFFVLYSDNIDRRRADHDLQETLFHESVHATLEERLKQRADWWARWQQAQQADAGFVTRYGARHPETEDLAESALFAWALTQHPGRLPQTVADQVAERMPHRLALLAALFEAEQKAAKTALLAGCAAQ